MSDGEIRVAIVGGGLAGLAAALALAERSSAAPGQKLAIELFEAKRSLGGRAGSFVDPQSGETIDHCQHVAMGCCANYFDFIRRVRASGLLRKISTLHFVGPENQRCDFTASRWLPAPLHLARGLWSLKYLTIAERVSIALALRGIERADQQPNAGALSAGDWLRKRGQSQRQIERFWSVVLTSALSDTVDRVSLLAARKVFVDGFMRSRTAHEVHVPTAPLATLYDDYIARRLTELGVRLRMQTPVVRIEASADEPSNSNHCIAGSSALTLNLRTGKPERFDAVILAAPWHAARAMLSEQLAAQIPASQSWQSLESAEIAAVHLWFDRPITDLDHAIFVGRLSQWLFARPSEIATRKAANDEIAKSDSGAYYQVVISASHAIGTTSPEAPQNDRIASQVVRELKEIFPAAADAQLLRSRVVTSRDAVFSPAPRSDGLRPAQRTPVANLFLAGDWTATLWPATMEGAVRSGYLAAEAALRYLGDTATIAIDS